MCADFLAFYLAGPLPGGVLGFIGALVILGGFVLILGVGRVSAWLAGALAAVAGVFAYAWVCSHFSSGGIVVFASILLLVIVLIITFSPGGWGDVWK